MLQYDVKAKYQFISRKFFGHEVFFNHPKATRVCIRSINQSNRFTSARLWFLFCSRVFISRSRKSLYPDLCGRGLRVISQTCTGKKRFTLAGKVCSYWALTRIGHPNSSARMQTKPYQLKGWIRTKRAWNGGKKWWTTMESRSKFPRRTYKIETSKNYRGIIKNKGVGTSDINQDFAF